MARERMVSRTITLTEATVMVVDKRNGVTSDLVFTVTGEYESEEKLLRAYKKRNKDINIELVFIKNITVSSNIYEMSETEFLQYAKPRA